VSTNMLCTAKLDMAELVNASDIDIFLADAAWAICSTHHTVLKASPSGAIFRCCDMIFDMLFIADMKTIEEHRQRVTDCNTDQENEDRIDYDCKVGQKILVRNEGIICKAQSLWQKDPCTIMTVHTNRNIMVQHGNKEEQLNFRRVKPFVEDNKLIKS
jgi:hypothetical protein